MNGTTYYDRNRDAVPARYGGDAAEYAARGFHDTSAEELIGYANRRAIALPTDCPSEPDNDPRLADGLRANQDFAEWWVRQFLPSVELEELIEIKPNITRERESWSAQCNSGRETDLHVVIKDRTGDHHGALRPHRPLARTCLHPKRS